jgi:hypothetical protein
MTSRGAEKMNNDTIGVDVSKDHLDAHRLAEGPRGGSPTTEEATKRSSNGSRRRLDIVSCSNRPDPIIAPSNARWASLAFRSSRSIRVRRAASPRDRQAGEDRSPGRGDSGSYGRLAGIAGAPGYKRDPARTEGALCRSRMQPPWPNS